MPIISHRSLSTAAGVGTNTSSHIPPTVIALGDGIKLRKVTSEDDDTTTASTTCSVEEESNNDRTLAVVTGWLHSTDRQLKPYLNFYHDRGIDTMTYRVTMKHILRPTTSIDQMKQVLDEITKQNPKKIIFHNFSTGGYLCGQFLRVLKEQPLEESNAIVNKIKAQVYDSPPDVRGIAGGLATHFLPQKDKNFYQRVLHKTIKNTIQGYLSLTEKTEVGTHHRLSSENFHENYIKAPALWYYSYSDPVANYEDCEIVISKWKKNGIPVETCTWEDSPHIQHGRLDPDRYFGTLDGFLKKHGVLQQQRMEQQEEDEEGDNNTEDLPLVEVEELETEEEEEEKKEAA